MQRDDEIELWDAADLLDVTEELLGRLAADGKLKSRHADGTVYFLREEIDELDDRQIAWADAQRPQRGSRKSTKAERVGNEFVRKRLNQLMPELKRRGLSEEATFDIAWRQIGRELGFTRIEIARTFLHSRTCEHRGSRRRKHAR